MENKKTKRDYFNELLALATTEEQKAFIAHELELLDKKHDNKKPTKAQEENEATKSIILDALLVAEKGVTITELLKTPELAGFTNQKVSALLKPLIEGGLVKRTEEKRVAYFSIV